MSAVQMSGIFYACAGVTDTRKTLHSAEDVHSQTHHCLGN